MWCLLALNKIQNTRLSSFVAGELRHFNELKFSKNIFKKVIVYF